MEPTNQIPQMPNLQVSPQPAAQPKMNLILIGVIVLLLLLLGLSFSQVLSLKQQVEKLETVAQPEPSSVATPASTGISTASVAPAPSGGTNEPLEIVGIIQKSDVEGGCWVINPNVPCTGDRCPLSEAASYEPINLPKELQKVGTKAKFKLEVQPEVATICQIGPAVKILDYQIIK